MTQPTDDMVKISPRQEQMLLLLARQEDMSVMELAERLHVSGWTVRRDLDNLARFNLVQRSHGRARISQFVDYASLAPSQQAAGQIVNLMEKRSIGLAAARLLRTGQRIVLSAGTTTMQVALALRDREGLSVVTNALNIAQVLASQRSIETICTGGIAHGDHDSLIGPIAEHALKSYFYDVAIIGVNGISLDAGITANSPLNVATVNIMIEHSASVMIVADHTKFDRKHFAHVAPLDSVTTVVTDQPPATAYVNFFAAHNIELIVVD